MIPKIIHYCWFGKGEKPKLAQKCIDSWKEHCFDYKIVEWNEDNFDINTNAYTKMCFEQSKYAFLSDYLRLIVVYKYGGIYFDTDVEVIKSIDNLLDNKAFFGFETDKYINTGQGFGAEADAEIINKMISTYDFLLDGIHGTVGCPVLNTRALEEYGFQINGMYQTIDAISLFPKDYFNPYNDNTGVLTKTENTYSIHWYGKSWMNKKSVFRNKMTRVIHRMGLGKK